MKPIRSSDGGTWLITFSRLVLGLVEPFVASGLSSVSVSLSVLLFVLEDAGDLPRGDCVLLRAGEFLRFCFDSGNGSGLSVFRLAGRGDGFSSDSDSTGSPFIARSICLTAFSWILKKI